MFSTTDAFLSTKVSSGAKGVPFGVFLVKNSLIDNDLQVQDALFRPLRMTYSPFVDKKRTNIEKCIQVNCDSLPLYCHEE